MPQKLTFELCYRKEAWRKGARGKFEADPEKTEELPDIPPQFSPRKGDYGYVAREANKLNEVQFHSGFLHYLFWPEVIT